MTVVDCHCHIYPEKIAERAVESVGDFYGIDMHGNGCAEALIEASKGVPITHHLVHSVAVKPKTVESINTFIMGECEKHDNFIGFMAMHQDYEDFEAEIERAIAGGLCGIKIHPDTQGVNLDDPRMMRVYEVAEKKELPIIFHTGDYRYDFSHPRRMKEVLHAFPNLVVDAAHFGGWSIYDLALEYMEDETCFMDMSSSMSFLGDRRTRELVEIYGADRIMFGSDFPMWSPKEEYERFRGLGFSDLEYEKMFYRNAERFVGRDIQ